MVTWLQRCNVTSLQGPGWALMQLWSAGPEEAFQDKQLEGEWRIAGVAQQGHFEYMQKLRAGRVIDPFGPGIIIPHLPEETADQRADAESNDGSPIAAAQVGDEVRPPQPLVAGFEDKKDGGPAEGGTDPG